MFFYFLLLISVNCFEGTSQVLFGKNLQQPSLVLRISWNNINKTKSTMEQPSLCCIQYGLLNYLPCIIQPARCFCLGNFGSLESVQYSYRKGGSIHFLKRNKLFFLFIPHDIPYGIPQFLQRNHCNTSPSIRISLMMTF